MAQFLQVALELFACLVCFLEILKLLQFFLFLDDCSSSFAHVFIVGLRHRLLMVTQDSHLPVAVFIKLDFGINGVFVSIDCALGQLFLQGV